MRVDLSFNTGGLHTSDAPRYHTDTSSLFNEPFKATPNPLVSGSVTSTPS
jgi:hypothetical protein